MTKSGFTALHLACVFARDETLKFLLNSKANIELLAGDKRQSILHLVVSRFITVIIAI